MEPLYNEYHWEPIGVPKTGASGVFPVGVVLSNRAVDHNVAAFSELSFAVR